MAHLPIGGESGFTLYIGKSRQETAGEDVLTMTQ